MSEWKIVKLGDVITFQRGYDLPKTKMIEGIYPVIGSNGIIGYHNEFTTNSPSITIGRSGNVGKPFIYKGKSWSHNTTLFVKEFKNVYPSFIYYLLGTLNLNHYAGGTAVPTLNRNHIHNLEINLPPLETQKKIAAVLSALDDKIELNNAINKNLEEQAQAIYKNMFVDNLNPAWKKGTLSDIAEITMGQSPSGKSYNDTGKGMIFFQGRTDFGFRFPTIRMFTTEPKRIAKKGDILLSVRAPVGDYNVATDNCCIGRGLASIYSKQNNSSFLLYTILHLKGAFDVFNGQGTVFGAINQRELKNIEVVVPEQSLINEFEKIVAPMDSIILNNCFETKKLGDVRDALLPRLMSGEIDVSKVEIFNEQ